MATHKRIYTVKGTDGSKRLVKAVSQPQAIHHVAKSMFSASIPSPDELVELVKAGVEVEEAGADENASEPAAA